MIFDDRRCELGEGPLWHPLRNQLFWFDILGKKLLTRTDAGPQEWLFGEMVSAAGWIDHDTLLIASETALFRFDLGTGAKVHVADLDADDPETRSNDGRADPQGGFWIGTMAKQEKPGAVPRGAIWRYFRGEVRKLFDHIEIPNAISFHPDGKTAFYADTVTGKVMRTAIDGNGWPVGAPDIHIDLTADGLNPDGAVVDVDGVLWLAQWGAGRVSAYGPEGNLIRSVPFDAPHTSCPAFGGPGLTTLFCTSALQHMAEDARTLHVRSGMVFAAERVSQGQPEHAVIL